VSLQALRDRAKPQDGRFGKLKASIVTGDVRQLHRLPEYEGALFQVASQFNALEMTHYEVTPEDGVTDMSTTAHRVLPGAIQGDAE
jgi:hypothetical protein